MASVHQHFLRLYAARGARTQCTLGYDSSAACDAYQLGEIVKFLTHRGLVNLADFSPMSLDLLGDSALLSLDSILATLRQCPSYQINKYHANCGFRTRVLPLLDFVQGLLAAASVPIALHRWRTSRAAEAWMPEPEDGAAKPEFVVGNGGKGPDSKQFRFTRSMAGDPRLRFENALGADRFARDFFTAQSWNWTAED